MQRKCSPYVLGRNRQENINMIFSPDVTYMNRDRNGQRQIQREMERCIFSLSIEKKIQKQIDQILIAVTSE